MKTQWQNYGQILHPGAILKDPNLKVKSYARNARQLTDISRFTTFNLKNNTALLLGTLIFLLDYSDYDLDYKRQRIY